ncbi:hypothetical protein [Nocardioides montaniterrae]
MNRINPYAKAVAAGVATFAGALGTALTDGTVTGSEWCGVVAATAIGIGAVFGIPNKPRA